MFTSGHEALLLTLFFGVTGYITHSVASRFGFRRSERLEFMLLRFLAYGAVNVLISLPVIIMHTKLLPRETWATVLLHNLPTYYVLAFCVLFFIPSILGLLFGLPHYLYDVQSWHRAPIAAWDEKIARSRGQWVLISLEGDTKVAGYLGRESSVVSDTGDHDLFLQLPYHVDEDGVWQKVPRSKGMLISSKLIQTIEFWEDVTQKPINIRERIKLWIKLWLLGAEGRVPPDFQSSLITSQSSMEKAPQQSSISMQEPLVKEELAVKVASQEAREAIHTNGFNNSRHGG